MEITLKLKEDKKYLEMIRILSNLKNPEIKPFNQLRNREMEVYAVLLYLYNERYSTTPKEDRDALVFSYDSRQEIAERLGDISKDTIYNIMMDLRKKGLIDKKNLKSSFILPNNNFIKLNFNGK